MGKKVLIIGGSPRKDGNSAALCEHFAKGASEAGTQVEMLSLSGKKIGFCTACYACENGNCPQQDDVPGIIAKMLDADVIVLATPVYFYTMSAQLKALIDRSVMVYPKIAKKEFYFIMTMVAPKPYFWNEASCDRHLGYLRLNSCIMALRNTPSPLP